MIRWEDDYEVHQPPGWFDAMLAAALVVVVVVLASWR